jgi:hypothetical protein
VSPRSLGIANVRKFRRKLRICCSRRNSQEINNEVLMDKCKGKRQFGRPEMKTRAYN